MFLKPINKCNFDSIINIKFNNILEGFDNYKYIELSPIYINLKFEDSFIKTFEEFYDINEGHLIIDFYKNKLNDESISYIKENLSKEDNLLFDKIISYSKRESNLS